MQLAASVFRTLTGWFSDHVFQRLLKNASWLMGGNALAAVIGLASMALMARALEPAGLGLVVLITTYVQLMDRLLNFQSWQAIVKYGAHAQKRNDAGELARLIKLGSLLDVGSALIGTLVAVAAAPWAASWLSLSGNETQWLVLYSLVILFNLGGVPTGVLRLTDRFHFLSLQKIVVAAVTLAGVSVAFALGAGVGEMLLASAAGQVLGNILLLVIGWRTLGEQGLSLPVVWRAPLRRPGAQDRDILSFFFFTNIDSSVKILREADVFIIGYLLNREAVGLYRVARRFAEIANMFVEPFFYAAFPSFNKLFANQDWAGFRQLALRSSIVVGAAVLAGWLVFVVIGQWLIELLFGGAYSAVYPIAVICMIAMVIWAFAQPLSPALFSTNGYRYVFAIHLGTSVAYILVLTILTSSAGLTGAAWAYTVFYLAWSALMLATLLTHVRRRDPHIAIAGYPMLSNGITRRAAHFFQSLFGSFLGSSAHRYKSRHALLNMLSRAWGLRVYNNSLYWFTDPEYIAMWRRFPEANNDIHERRYNLFNLSKSVSDLDGDTVECGVLNGAGSHIILSAAGTDSRHHIFDSFEGLSEPGPNDEVKVVTPYVWKKHDLSVPEDRVRRNLAAFGDRVIYYKGWIPDRFGDVADRHFKLVHIDVDLHQPTHDALAFFYERTVPGGLIICDDYGSEICPGAKQAFDDFMKGRRETVIHLTTGQGVVIKR
jgi:O-antigen/teichoic acid export membrane protein